MKDTNIGDYQVLVAEFTGKVWVNSLLTGECVARFDPKAGMEIRRTRSVQEVTGQECFTCEHSPQTYDVFVDAFKRYYDVDISPVPYNFA
jgi:hypothetical protein